MHPSNDTPMVTYLAAGPQCPLAGIKLVTDTHTCEQLAHCHYMKWNSGTFNHGNLMC